MLANATKAAIAACFMSFMLDLSFKLANLTRTVRHVRHFVIGSTQRGAINAGTSCDRLHPLKPGGRGLQSAEGRHGASLASALARQGRRRSGPRRRPEDDDTRPLRRPC